MCRFLVTFESLNCRFSVALSGFFYVKIRVIEVYDEDLRERLLSREQIQKLDLVTQTTLFSVIEDVLEEREHDKQSLSTADDLYPEL